MKIKVLGNELIDPEIEFLSLVKRGANREPFKIMKMEDAQSTSTKTPIGDRVRGMLGHSDEIRVNAVFAKSDVASDVEAILVESGFEIDRKIVEGDVTAYPQYDVADDAELEVGTLVAINDNVGVGLNQVLKEFAPYPNSTDFNENQSAGAFLPSLSQGMDALIGTIWNVLEGSSDPDMASAGVTKALNDFGKYAKGLMKSLPQSVFKAEMGLRGSLASNTVSKERISPVEKTDMQIKEDVSGDLDGLTIDPVQKTEAESETATIETEAETKESAPEVTVKTGKRKMKKGDEIVEREYEFEDIEGEEIFLRWLDEEVTKDETAETEAASKEDTETKDDESKKEVTKEEAPVSADIAALTSAVANLTAIVTKNSEDMATIAKTALDAKETAEHTVVINPLAGADESLGIRDREVAMLRKSESEKDVWKGSSLDMVVL